VVDSTAPERIVKALGLLPCPLVYDGSISSNDSFAQRTVARSNKQITSEKLPGQATQSRRPNLAPSLPQKEVNNAQNDRPLPQPFFAPDFAPRRRAKVSETQTKRTRSSQIFENLRRKHGDQVPAVPHATFVPGDESQSDQSGIEKPEVPNKSYLFFDDSTDETDIKQEEVVTVMPVGTATTLDDRRIEQQQHSYTQDQPRSSDPSTAIPE
jgi:hypothetical protein